MRAKRLCISLIWTTPVKPASRNPSSRIAARIGLSSTMTILGDDSALIDQSPPGKGIHTMPTAGAKGCNYGQFGLAPADQSGRFRYATGRSAESQLCLLGMPQGAGGFRAHHHAAARGRL